MQQSDLKIAPNALDMPVVGRSDIVVVGGGPAGVSAAVSAARSGASVTLLERYPSLGGLASGGMVLVLDDMANGPEISVTGIVSEYVERLEKLDLVVVPPIEDRHSSRRGTSGAAGAPSTSTRTATPSRSATRRRSTPTGGSGSPTTWCASPV